MHVYFYERPGNGQNTAVAGQRGKASLGESATSPIRANYPKGAERGNLFSLICLGQTSRTTYEITTENKSFFAEHWEHECSMHSYDLCSIQKKTITKNLSKHNRKELWSMELKKYQSSEILSIIRHNMRILKTGQNYGNLNIDPSLSYKNISLISRGSTPAQVNAYRKNLEKEIFSYKRKNLVHAVSVVIQLPDDCPPDQEELFYKECLNFWAELLPMGERCIFMAEVHKDEIVLDSNDNRISHDHMHIMFVPGVPDQKHDRYKYKLCADQLTKKSVLKTLHPDLQNHLNQVGIKATVHQKSDGNGQKIKLSVTQLKEFTNLTGKSISKTLTINELADLVNNISQKEQLIESLSAELDSMSQKLGETERLLEKYKESELKNKEEKTSNRTFTFGQKKEITKESERSFSF